MNTFSLEKLEFLKCDIQHLVKQSTSSQVVQNTHSSNNAAFLLYSEVFIYSAKCELFPLGLLYLLHLVDSYILEHELSSSLGVVAENYRFSKAE